jgi:hypothetical protein
MNNDKSILQLILEFLGGLSITGLSAYLDPEIKHGIYSIIIAVLSTIAIHYTRKLLGHGKKENN